MLTAAALAALLLGLMQYWVGDVLTWIGRLSPNLTKVSLCIEQVLTPEDGGNIVSAALVSDLFHLLYDVACVLMLLKFLWKGFQIYVLWRDGDSDVSPHNMLIGILLAIVLCAAFPTLYDMAADITVSVGKSIVQVIDPTGAIPGMSGDLESDAQRAYQRLMEQLDANQDEKLTYREWFPIMDTNDDGELSDDELLPYFDEDGNGYLDNNERTRYQVSFQNNHEGISFNDFKQWYIEEHTVDFDERISNMSWLEILFLYIYAGAHIIMWIRLMGRGFEMLFMRVGFPLAAIGLIDSDGGVFKSYTQLMFRQMLTSIFQVAALRLSLLFLPNLSFTGLLLSIAILLAAFRTPKLLQQIMTPQGGGSGFGAKVYQGAMVLRMLKK